MSAQNKTKSKETLILSRNFPIKIELISSRNKCRTLIETVETESGNRCTACSARQFRRNRRRLLESTIIRFLQFYVFPNNKNSNKKGE